MARAVGIQLAEGLQVIEGDRGPAEHLVVGVHRPDAGQVQQRPQQRRGVPLRQHEAVPVRPDRITRVEAEEALPQRVGDRGHTHRGSRVTRVGLLNRVHAQGPDGVDRDRVRFVCRRGAHCGSMIGCLYKFGSKQSLSRRGVQGGTDDSGVVPQPGRDDRRPQLDQGQEFVSDIADATADDNQLRPQHLLN